jgi:hypothetical protein
MPTDLLPNPHYSLFEKLVAFFLHRKRAQVRSIGADGLSDRLLADIGLPRCMLIAGVPATD